MPNCAKAMSTNFSKNLRHLYEISGCTTQSEFAFQFAIDRSRMNKLLGGKAASSRAEKIKLSMKLGPIFDRIEDDHKSFIQYMENEGVRRFIDPDKFKLIRSTDENRTAEINRYKGQYILYYGGGEKSEYCISSLVTIGKSYHNGLEFKMINPYRFTDGQYGHFAYDGVMYLSDVGVFMIAEQVENDYEILSMIFHSSPLSDVRILRGVVSGIGIRGERRYVASNAAVLLKRTALIHDWQKSLGRELAYLPIAKLPEIVRQYLKHERIVIE